MLRTVEKKSTKIKNYLFCHIGQIFNGNWVVDHTEIIPFT